MNTGTVGKGYAFHRAAEGKTKGECRGMNGAPYCAEKDFQETNKKVRRGHRVREQEGETLEREGSESE
jgi:hypothetical protein